MVEHGNIIYSYTRTQALADGVLVDITSTAKEAGIQWPTAVTQQVWQTYITWDEADTLAQTYQDTEGRLWDMVYCLRLAIQRQHSPVDWLYFTLYCIPKDGYATQATFIRLKAICGPGDAGEPVMTIMLPEED